MSWQARVENFRSIRLKFFNLLFGLLNKQKKSNEIKEK